MTPSVESPASLEQSADSGIIPAKYLYGLQCADPDERKRWLLKATSDCDTSAMHESALECGNPQERKRWLHTAAAKGSSPRPR